MYITVLFGRYQIDKSNLVVENPAWVLRDVSKPSEIERLMELKSHIKLSKKHQKKLSVFPYFFIPALNEFYFLRDDFGFRKPELATWKNEANLIFMSKTLRVNIQYEYPNWIDLTFRKHDSRDYIYWRILLEELNFHLNE